MCGFQCHFREEGADGLVDRSSRQHHCPHALAEATKTRIVAARTERQTYRQISQPLKVGHSSVARVLVRAGLNLLACLEPAAPIQRYEYDSPGEMLHLDIKKLGRFNRSGHRVSGSNGEFARCGLGIRLHRHRRSFAHRHGQRAPG